MEPEAAEIITILNTGKQLQRLRGSRPTGTLQLRQSADPHTLVLEVAVAVRAGAGGDDVLILGRRPD